MDIKNYLVKPKDKLQKVIEVINNNKDGIVLVVDESGKLVGSITDGDIRRCMLSGHSFDKSCVEIMHDKPVTSDANASRKNLIQLIKQHRIRNIPLIDENGHPIRIVNIAELINGRETGGTALIMAGGEGRRLRPLTDSLPKPMIKVGDKPLLEQIIRNLAKAEVNNIYISVNYQAKVIQDYFKDGQEFGVNIKYLKEEKKLGTAGALSLLSELPSHPLLVMNGDVMTNINFNRFIEFHIQQRCTVTMAAIDYHLNVPYGVIKFTGTYVLGIEEKPKRQFLCNAGIYVIDTDIISMVPENTYYDMTDFLEDVLNKGLHVSVFPIHEQWIDIGQKDDLKKANESIANTHEISKKEKND